MQDLEVQSFLPLKRAVYHILVALAGGERHGYAIMQEIGLLSNGTYRIGPGALYTSIKRMTDDGLIEEATGSRAGNDEDARRRYYRLTDLGRLVAGAESRRLEALVDIARSRRLLEQPANGRI